MSGLNARHARAASLALGALLLLAAPARAAPEPQLDMAWEAPPGCPTYSDVESWLHAVVPPDARARLAELHVQVSITGSSSAGFRASVRVIKDGRPMTPSEPRVVAGAACDEVARSAIVVVSVAMSDAIKAEVAPPVPNPLPAQEAPPVTPASLAAPAPAPVDRVQPRARRASEPTVLVIAMAGAESGFIGQPGFRLDLSASLTLGRATFAGLRVHSLPVVALGQEAELGRLHFVAAGAELCHLPRLSHLIRVGACARAEFGFAWAQGARPDDPNDSGPVGAVALSPTLAMGGQVQVLLQGDLELRVVRPRFENTAGEVLAGLPPLAVSGLAGLALALP